VTLVTDLEYTILIIIALHVNRKVCKIYNAINVFLFCSFSLSLLPLSPLPTSTPLYVLMLRVKAPAALAHHFEFLLIGSLKIYLATVLTHLQTLIPLSKKPLKTT
jgi:hypothetical protein